MKNLGTFHIVEKETSFETGGWENTKKGVYRIKDNYVIDDVNIYEATS